MKSVVVIVVNFNSGTWLSRCIESLLASSYPIEIFIVDNASTDDSLTRCKAFAEQHNNLHIIENRTNLGFGRANNLVLNTVDADYYVLVNPDCMIRSDTIEYMINSMQQDRHVGMAGSRILNEDGSVQRTSKRRFPTPENSLTRILGISRFFSRQSKFSDFNLAEQAPANEKEYVEAISGAFMVVSADALDQVGGLDEGYFMHCEDLDWCKRVWLHGFKVAYYPQAEIIHGKGKSSQSNPYRVNWYLHKGMMRFYKKFYRKNYGLLTTAMVYLGITLRLSATQCKIFLQRLLFN